MERSNLNNVKNKKKYRGCLYVIIGILVTFSVFIYMLFFQQHTLAKSKAPDSSQEIIIKYKNALFFGPQEVFIYYKKNNSLIKHKLITTLIYNDGKSLDDENYKFNWENEIVEISLIGEEQEAEIYSVNLNDNNQVTKIQELKRCPRRPLK